MSKCARVRAGRRTGCEVAPTPVTIALPRPCFVCDDGRAPEGVAEVGADPPTTFVAAPARTRLELPSVRPPRSVEIGAAEFASCRGDGEANRREPR
jgi:hypothetical protein